MNRRRFAVLTAAGLGCMAAVSLAADTGTPFDVAPLVEKTRFQHWPRAAWAAQSKCWLVVWREGDLNEQEADIWCARVSMDGASLDPNGIRITTAKDVQDRPVAASDGKDFLVAWQDLRNGKDWDVYAARVSGEGKVFDPDGFLLAGGPHNQCLPSVVFAGKNYYAAWQSWVEDALVSGYGSYEARGARVSPEGKVLDATGIVLAKPTALQPSLAWAAEGGLVLMTIGRTKAGLGGSLVPQFPNKPGWLRIDSDTGKAMGQISYVAGNFWDTGHVPGVVVMEDGSCLANWTANRSGLTLFRLGKDGLPMGESQVFHGGGTDSPIVPTHSLASGGERVLMTYDYPTDKESLGDHPWRMKVWGWLLGPDGRILDGGKGGLLIAGDGKLDAMQGFSCAGPEGKFLVVHSEARAVEDTKVVARVVR